MALLIFIVVSMFASSALAYDEFFFTSSETSWQCPKLPYQCPPPSACAHDPVLDKTYCCGAGDDAICWSGNSECDGSGTNQPASNQIGCSSGDNAFCCLKDREQCTQRFNQINICWATPTNVLTNLTEQQMNETYSSLASASPKASSFIFDPQKLLATSTPVSTSASATATTTSSAVSSSASSSASSSTSSPTGGPDPGSSSSLSGGAIGGVVVGVVGGLALIGAGGFFLFRRNRNKSERSELDNNPYANNSTHNGYGAVAQDAPTQEKYAQNAAHEAPAPIPGYTEPIEMASSSGPVEMEGSRPNKTSQLPHQ